MNTARGFFHLIRISLTVFATICPFDVAAESANAASSIDDLFRKAGISKISLGAAADFALRDLSGNTVTLGSYLRQPGFIEFLGDVVRSVPRRNAFDGATAPATWWPGAYPVGH